MCHKTTRRILSLLLVLAMILTGPFSVTAVASPTSGAEDLTFHEVDAGSVSTQLDSTAGQEVESLQTGQTLYEDTDQVRVTIFLEPAATLARFDSQNVASNVQAMSYRQTLAQKQEEVQSWIEAATGQELQVAWNMTLATNAISANVEYGQIQQILDVSGVKDVVIETRYEPAVVEQDLETDPNMATSSEMIGSGLAWASGYTGAGSRVAIIDTGIDTDHQSMDADAYWYSLQQQAKEAGVDFETYVEGLNLLDQAEIDRVWNQLNISDRAKSSRVYINSKLPFGYNYVDTNYFVNHDHDTQGGHGSHVAGIAAANDYIKNADGSFSPALDTAKMQGVAPDAQILTMKVFGNYGGAYDSDYMAAIEDAIVLGADAVNLSLGSANPGATRPSSEAYQAIMDSLTDSGVVVCISAGNSGGWSDYDNNLGYLYSDEVSMHTGGAPGTYTNALTVASADNVGNTGHFFAVGDKKIFYTESTNYGNAPITSLSGTYEYVVLTGYGSVEDYAALGNALEGRIAVCSRGELTFTEKATGAVNAGAVGTIIFNNTSGTINLALDGYEAKAPCVSISQAEGEYMKSSAKPVTDQAGNVLYYLGSLTITDEIDYALRGDEYQSMSYFSSWGVPSSLELKPEITAPGGNIYSLDGVTYGGKGYANNSGTSMASPQVAGISAVLAQYIRESGLEEKTGLDARQLIQSLIMSTATPIRDGENGGYYYPVLQQGAGLANVYSAIAADSVILMDENATDSASDGKVKAELGDDPDRQGLYSFSFTLQNITDQPLTYRLSADFFTQGTFRQDGETYLDTQTQALEVSASWTADGATLPLAEPLTGLDFNGDGEINVADGQALMDYVIGGTPISCADKADLDGDGAVNTYDVHLFLSRYSTGLVTVEAGQKVKIGVEVALTQAQKEALDESNPNGAYVEGYVLVSGLGTPEGVAGTQHSIPVLGFYGNWSDPSMYEDVTFSQAYNGEEVRATHTGITNTNGMAVLYPNNSTAYWYVEHTGAPERNAINSQTELYQYVFTLIRNASAVMALVTDSDGQLLWTSEVYNQASPAFYYTNAGYWTNIQNTMDLGFMASDLGIEEGEQFTVSLVSIPEYYDSDELFMGKDRVLELLDSGELGRGVSVSTTLTLDDTAPEIQTVSKDLTTGALTVTARDNQYLSTVAVLNKNGTRVLAQAEPEQTQAGASVSTVVDLTGITVGETCIVVVEDCAKNQSYYEVNYDGQEPDDSGKLYAFAADAGPVPAKTWVQIHSDQLYFTSTTDFIGLEALETTTLNILAAEYVDGSVFVAADDGNLYVTGQGDWVNYEKVGSYASVTDSICDLAMNYADGKLYALGSSNDLYTVDLVTGKLTLAYTLTLTNPNISGSLGTRGNLASLAIDDEGNFYAVNYTNSYDTSFLYTWKSSDAVDGAITDLAPVNNTKAGYTGTDGDSAYRYCSGVAGTMAWDHDADVLYWASSYNTSYFQTYRYLWTMDTATGKATRVNTTYAGESETANPAVSGSITYSRLNGLYIVPAQKPLGATDQAVSITLSRSEMKLLPGCTTELTAEVMPWGLEDKSVTWFSSNESVVQVEDGVVTALAEGSATIQAVTKAEPHLEAACTVTVAEAEVRFSALVRNETGSQWTEFSTDNLSAASSFGSGRTIMGGTAVGDTLYYHDGTCIYSMDADTLEETNLGTIDPSWLWSDAAPAPKIGESQFGDVFGFIVGLCNNGTYLEMVRPEEGTLKYIDLANYLDEPAVAIAFVESGTYYYDPSFNNNPANYYYVLTESGKLYYGLLFTINGGYTYSPRMTLVGDTGLNLGAVSKTDGSAFASMVYDPETELLVLSTGKSGQGGKLYLLDPAYAYARELGQTNGTAVCLYQYDRLTEVTVQMKSEPSTIYVEDKQQLSVKVKPVSFTGGVVWSSSDETVATVDKNGLVTGVAPGTATITATSVDKRSDGTTSSASVEITVKALDSLDTEVRVSGQITLEDGSAQWVDIDVNSLATTKLADAATSFTAGGMSQGKLYGTDSDFETDGAGFYVVDPASNYAQKTLGQVSADDAPLDVASVPFRQATSTGGKTIDAFGAPFYVTNNQRIVMNARDENGEPDLEIRALDDDVSFTGYDLSTMAFVGLDDWGDQEVLMFLSLGKAGSLFIIFAKIDTVDELGDPRYTFMGTTFGSTSLVLEDTHSYSMAYDSDTNFLVLADSTDGGALYYIDLNSPDYEGGNYPSGKLGYLPGVRSISSLYGDLDLCQRVEDLDGRGMGAFQNGSAILQSLPISLNTSLETLERFTGKTAAESAQNEAGGSLNSVVTSEQKAQPQSDPDTVTLQLTSDQAAANGKLTLTFDTDALALQSVKGLNVQAFAWKESNGTVVLGYADDASLLAGTPVAELTFTRKTGLVSNVTVLWQEQIPDASDEKQIVTIFCRQADCPSKGFTDLKQDTWYHDSVDYVLSFGFMKGTSATTFDPNGDTTRAAMATVLYRMAGSPQVTGSNPFTDVKEGTWYTEAVNWAYENGIVKGVTEELFAPNRAITRQEAATMIYRFSGAYLGADVSKEADLSSFPDSANVQPYARQAMAWAVEQGIILGSDGRLKPHSQALRAELAAIVMRIHTLVMLPEQF